MLNPTVQVVKGQAILPLSTSAAIQITSQEIMVMGGYDENNAGHKQTYILKIDENNSQMVESFLAMYANPVVNKSKYQDAN